MTLKCYRILRDVVEVSLRCPKVSKNVLEQDASFPEDVLRIQEVSMRRLEVSKGVSEVFMRCL